MAFNSLVLLLTLLAVVPKTETAPRYDPATVVDFPVDVTEVREASGDNGLNGIWLTVRTENDKTMNVYLGPASFLKEFEVVFAKGDNIHVVGSKVSFGGGSIILAREVSKGQATLYLRDRNGVPYWHSGN